MRTELREGRASRRLYCSAYAPCMKDYHSPRHAPCDFNCMCCRHCARWYPSHSRRRLRSGQQCLAFPALSGLGWSGFSSPSGRRAPKPICDVGSHEQTLGTGMSAPIAICNSNLLAWDVQPTPRRRASQAFADRIALCSQVRLSSIMARSMRLVNHCVDGRNPNEGCITVLLPNTFYCHCSPLPFYASSFHPGAGWFELGDPRNNWTECQRLAAKLHRELRVSSTASASAIDEMSWGHR